MSSHDERARDGSRRAANRRTGHFGPAARTLILASVSLSLIGCRDPAVPASAPAQVDDARAFYERGNAWATKMAYDKAIADYSEAIRIHPKIVLAYYERGLAWQDKQEYDKAIADFTAAIRLDPKHARAYYNRGDVWVDKLEYDKAIADYSEAIRVDPKLAGAYIARGMGWSVAKQEYDKAIADFTAAIRIKPELASAYRCRGSAWQKKQEYDKAIADFTEVIRIDPSDANSYNGRAWIWTTCPDAKYRDGKRAVESATRACELSGWNEPNDMNTLAAACAEAADFDAAVQWQSKAIELLSDEKRKADYRTRLTLYREKKPYREPPRPKS